MLTEYKYRIYSRPVVPALLVVPVSPKSMGADSQGQNLGPGSWPNSASNHTNYATKRN